MTKENKCTWLGIGVKIQNDSKLYGECIKINKILCDKYESTTVFSDFNVPHLNLYDLDVPAINLPKIVEDIGTVIKEQKAFSCATEDIKAFPFGLVFAEVDPDPNIMKLHEEIVMAVSPHKGTCVCTKRAVGRLHRYCDRRRGRSQTFGQFSYLCWLD